MMGRGMALLLTATLLWAASTASSAEDDLPPAPQAQLPGSSFGRPSRIPDENEIRAIFNKVAYGTTAAPPTSHRPSETRSQATTTTTPPPPTTTTGSPPLAQPSTLPTLVPPPTNVPALLLPPPPGVRRPHVQPPEYSPPRRPPPLPAEYNPFANKLILRDKLNPSDGGSSSTSVRRAPPPAILPPRAPPERELIPLRPVNTPSLGEAGNGEQKLESPTVVATQDIPDSIPESNGEREPGGGDAAQDQAVVADSGDRQRAANPTDLIELVDLEQVNKDSIIGVQVPRSENRPGKSGPDSVEMGGTKEPPYHGQQPAPDSPSESPAQPPARSPHPGSDWTSTSAADDSADSDLRLARALHVYIGAALFASLAILAAAAGLRAVGCGGAWGRRGLAPRKHLAALALLLVAVGAANCAALICEVFAEDDRSSAELLANVVLPCVPAAFALFLFVVMQRNQVWCGRAGSYGFRTPALSLALFLGLGCCTALDATAATGAPSLFYLHLASRGLVITACSLLGLVVVCLFRRMDRAAAKTQSEQLRAAFSTTTMSPFQRGSRPALRCAVRALLAAALLLLSLAALLLYQLIHMHLLISDRSTISWLPWSLRCGIHASILSVCFLLLWGATRGYGGGCNGSSGSSRGGGDSTAGEALRGVTAGNNGVSGCGGGGPTLSLVSCGGRRFLFDCPSTGSDENRSSEDGAYPAVCASNRAILNYTQSTGRKVYDDNLALSSLHSGAPSSSGDDFSNMPTMPKRRPAHYKSGTLLPPHYKDKNNSVTGGGNGNGGSNINTSSRRPGVHTLGPSNHIYADDNYPHYASLTHEVQPQQGTAKRSSRSRKNRHSKHRGEDLEHRLDGLADEFQVFKQYASSSEDTGDNYEVPMFVNVPQVSNTRRNRGAGEEVRSLRRRPHVDSLSPASPSDLSDCDRLSSSYDETAPMRPPAQLRGKALLKEREASEDDVTPDSAVVADILSDKTQTGMSPVDKRAHPRRLPRRPQQHMSHETPSSPEVHERRNGADNPW